MNRSLTFIFFLLFSVSSVIHSQTANRVYIVSNFTNSSIWVDGDSTGLHTPAWVDNLGNGERVISLKYPDVSCEYFVKQTLSIPAADTVEIDFRPISVTFASKAETTGIYLNGCFKGYHSDIKIVNIIPGTHTIKLVQPYGITAEKRVTILPEYSENMPECFQLGHLKIESQDITGADIYLNRKKTGKTIPAQFDNLIAGDYTITAKIGGKKYSKTTAVVNGETNIVTINPKLEKAARDSISAALWKANAPVRKESIKNIFNKTIFWGMIGGAILAVYFSILRH